MKTNKQTIKEIYKFVHKITLSILVIGAVMTVFIASFYRGYTAVLIIVAGCIISRKSVV